MNRRQTLQTLPAPRMCLQLKGFGNMTQLDDSKENLYETPTYKLSTQKAKDLHDSINLFGYVAGNRLLYKVSLNHPN